MTCTWDDCSDEAVWLVIRHSRVHGIRPDERASCVPHLGLVAATAALELRSSVFDLVGVDKHGPVAT